MKKGLYSIKSILLEYQVFGMPFSCLTYLFPLKFLVYQRIQNKNTNLFRSYNFEFLKYSDGFNTLQ